MTYEIIIPLLIFLAPLAYSPGPGNMFFATLGAAGGLRGAVPALTGYHVATLLVTMAVGLGFGWVQAMGPGLARAMQWAGAAYVIWLAWQIAQAGPMTDGQATSGAAGFRAGAVLLLLNPKAWLILSLLFSQFPVATLGQAALVTLIFTMNNLVAFVLWTIAGDALASVFRSQAGARRLNIVFAMALAGVAIWMFLAG